MNRPRMDRRLVLEARGDASDGAGGRVEAWHSLGTLWCALKPRRARSTRGAGGAVAQGRFEVILPAAPVESPARPRPGQRFRSGARLFRILTVTETDASARTLTCDVEEEVSA